MPSAPETRRVFTGGLWKCLRKEGSLIFPLSQFPSVVVTGQVLRELNQVSAGGECPTRPWRARAKSDLQLGGPENLPALPPTCHGTLALSGVLRRLQQVEEKIVQVKDHLSLPVSVSEWLPPSLSSCPQPIPSPPAPSLSPVFCVLGATQAPNCSLASSWR